MVFSHSDQKKATQGRNCYQEWGVAVMDLTMFSWEDCRSVWNSELEKNHLSDQNLMVFNVGTWNNVEKNAHSEGLACESSDGSFQVPQRPSGCPCNTLKSLQE